MWTYLKRIWNDPVLFESLVRALIKGLGVLAFSGVLDTGSWGWWAGLFALALGGEVPIPKKNGTTAPLPPPKP